MGKVLHVDFRQKQTPDPTRSFNRISPPRRVGKNEHVPFVLEAIANRNTHVLDTLDPQTDLGIITFKRLSVERRFLQAAYNDDVLSAKIILSNNNYPDFDKNALTYWTFPGKAKAHFLTAAHLTRSRPMAELLLNHGVDFNKLNDRGIHPFMMIATNTTNPDMHAFLKEKGYEPDNVPLSSRFPDLGL